MNSMNSSLSSISPVVHLLGGRACAVVGSALVAAAVRRSRRVVLVDRFRWGGGADAVLGLDHLPGVRWHDLVDADGEFDPVGLRRRLPTERDGRCALAQARTTPVAVPAAVRSAAVHALARECDLVVTLGPEPLDDAMPPGQVLVVAEHDVVSVSAAVALAGGDHDVVLLGRPGTSDVEDELGPRLTCLNTGRSVWRDLDRGRLVGDRALARWSDELLDELEAQHWSQERAA